MPRDNQPNYSDCIGYAAQYLTTSLALPNPGTIAADFIIQLDRAVELTARAYDQQQSAPRGLTEAVDLACDALYDAEIQREDIMAFGGLVNAQRINIAFSDGSHATAIVSWGEDQIDLFDQRITDDGWLNMSDRCVTINPWGDAGMRVFDNLEAGSNAFPPYSVLQDDPDTLGRATVPTSNDHEHSEYVAVLAGQGGPGLVGHGATGEGG